MPPQPRRLLFVAPPLTGHVNPTVALGRGLSDAGHAVAWAGSELFLRPLIGADAELHGTGSKPLRPQAVGHTASVRTLWNHFVVPYARFTLRAVDRAIADFQPNLVIADEHSPAGALAAERRGVPWVTLATSSMELGDPLRREHPELADWILGELRALWSGARLDRTAFVDPRASPRLVLALTSPALTGPVAFPANYALVGPLLGSRPAGPPFPWTALDPDRRHVLVTMGTLAADVAADFLRHTLAALGRLADRVQGIVVAPPDVPLGEVPAGVLVLPHVPLLDLFRRGVIDAVVCHGGLNTVTEALAHRIPLVLAPVRHDQPITAAQVVTAGAGVRVDYERVRAADLSRVISSVLDDPAHRRAAADIAGRFAADGGVPAAVARLEQVLLDEPSPTSVPGPVSQGAA